MRIAAPRPKFLRRGTARRAKPSKSLWNSLEASKVFVGATSSAVLAIAGILISHQVREADERRLRETAVSQTEFAMAELHAAVTQTAELLLKPAGDDEIDAVIEKARTELRAARRVFNQTATKLDFQMTREVFGDRPDLVRRWWYPAQRAQEDAYSCVANALRNPVGTMDIRANVLACKPSGKSAPNSKADVFENAEACRRTMLTAARVASRDPDIRAETLEKRVLENRQRDQFTDISCALG